MQNMFTSGNFIDSFNKKNLNKSKFRLQLGFIYNEYTGKGYYWEIVKIFQRMSITMVLNFFDVHINIPNYPEMKFYRCEQQRISNFFNNKSTMGIQSELFSLEN